MLADVTSYETASLVLGVEVVVVLVVIIIRTAIGKLHDTIAKGKGAFLFSGKKMKILERDQPNFHLILLLKLLLLSADSTKNVVVVPVVSLYCSR